MLIVGYEDDNMFIITESQTSTIISFKDSQPG